MDAMEIRSINSVQRVANFTLDDGKMLEVEHSEAVDLIPGVTMICELPLLFRNGFPTCLENLTVAQLEEFVPYMIRCSGGPPQTKPKWWPDEVYSTELRKTSDMTDKNWLSYLKRLVSHCYSYHGCEYALKLCADPSHKCRSTKRTSECELENSSTQVYEVPRGMPATRRSAKMCFNIGYNSASRSVNNSPKRNADNEHLRNKSPVQIYLCDNCDSEFRTSKEIRAHENMCFEVNTCKSSVLPVNIRKTNPNRYTLRNNNELNMQIATSTVARRGSAVLSKIQTVKQMLPYVNSRILMSPNSLVEMPSKPSEPCKNCGKLFVSSKLLRDHASICLKQQTLLARFLSSSSNTITPSNIDRRKHLNYPYKSSGTTASEADAVPNLRKKRMKLLPSRKGQNNSKDISHSDIFLCDNCDKEFASFADIQRHEAFGCEVRRELIPSPVPERAHELPPEENFLRYFALFPTSKALLTLRSVSGSASRGKKINPLRHSAIPVSSPLGSLIHGSQVPTSAILSKIEKIERYCPAKSIRMFQHVEAKSDSSEWRISWKPRKNIAHETTHSYIYPLKRWWKMPKVWSTQKKVAGRNRQLLRRCKSVQIKIRKLTSRDIELYSACRTVRPTVRKLTREEICLYSNL